MAEIRAMLTGHRPGAKLNEDAVLPSLIEILDTLREEHDDVVTVITGGANGADRLWARAAHRSKLKYELWVPASYYEHYKLINEEWVKNLIWNAEKIEWIGGIGQEFSVGNNFARNVAMIDTSNVRVVCSYKHPKDMVKLKSGGTTHCVKELQKRNIGGIWVDSKTGETEVFSWEG